MDRRPQSEQFRQSQDDDFNSPDFSLAFQPMVDIDNKRIFGHEALARGLEGQSAQSVLYKINANNRYQFDQTVRRKAIQMATKLDLDGILAINFLPNAIYNPQTGIRATLQACDDYGFPIEKIMFEVTEAEEVKDKQHLKNIISWYKKRGFITAIDEFGGGHSGLNLLVEWQPDVIKLDKAMIRDIHNNTTRQILIRSIIDVAKDLNIRVIASGVEQRGEFIMLRDFGLSLFQGFFFAEPVFEGLATIDDSQWESWLAI